MHDYLFKALAVFGFSVVAVLYLFIEKDLVYVGDLTGAQANLLEYKDEFYEADSMVYVDRIELPLVLYYSQSPFEIVEFGPLGEILKDAVSNNQRVIFITKESRLRKYKETISDLKLIKQDNEWVLAEHYVSDKEEPLE